MESMNAELARTQTENMKTVLVVDDNETMCSLIKLILGRDYKVEIRFDGQEALNYLNQGNKPDLILLDMMMPIMNGRTFVRRVHGNPRYGNVPIIFITTVDSAMLANSFKNMGVVDYIIKPFNNADLLKRVNDFLK